MIKYHSQVGIITNSSTELFTIDKPPENIMVILEGMIELHNKVNGTELEYSDVFKPVTTYTQALLDEDEAEHSQWRKDYIARKGEEPNYDIYWGYEKQETVGRTMIEGAGDNTIPTWMFGVIGDLMGDDYDEGVERFHLG